MPDSSRRRGGRAPAVFAGLMLVAVPGCRRAHEVVAHVPAHRLADDRAADRGRREAPAAAVGDVTRYVLADLPKALLYPPGLPAPGVVVAADGGVEIELRCPPELAGRDVVVAVTAGERRLESPGRVFCPAGESSRTALRLTGLEPGTTVAPMVAGFGEPVAGVASRPVALEPGSLLRVALGVADPRPPAEAVAARFTVRAEGDDGRTTTVFTRILDPAREPADRGWVEVEVALDAARRAVGAQARLRFETDAVGPPGALAFPAWGDPTIFVPVSDVRPDVPRNVILVSLDTLRADRLGCYGFPLPTSPNLDRLAADGTLFEVAIAQANWTLPSHLTMLTGVYPCAHGGGSLEYTSTMVAGLTPLAELLRRRGFATAAFTEDAYLDPTTFQRGFEVFRASATWEDHAIADTLAHASAWLRAHRERDFFLFIHTYEVHGPYHPPDAYRALFPPLPMCRADTKRCDAPEAADAAAAYAAAVRYADEQLGMLVALLAELDLDAKTILVVTSDHGEAFGEHGHGSHGTSLYEEDLRVPFIWHAPGFIASGRRVGWTVVGLVDIVPTVLDLLGVAKPPWVQGASLADLLNPDEEPVDRPSRILFSESTLTGHLAARGLMWKAIFGGLAVAAFPLRTDPHELNPAGGRVYVPMATTVRARFLDDCERVRGLLVGPAVEAAAPPVLDLERALKLRALGYL